MNYLAHLFLSPPDPESLAGNLAGDFVRGLLRDRFTPAIREGIRHHRQLDAFTDAHPAISRLRHLLLAEHGHYARIIGDVFIDHFLAAEWSTYTDEPLHVFVARVHDSLDGVIPLMPERLQIVYPIMRDQRWLESYGDVSFVESTLARLSTRLSRRPQLETAAHHLVDSREQLQMHVRDFFPDAIRAGRALNT